MAEKKDPDTPTDTEPEYRTSTPFSSDSKPNVAEMFKKMGDKLGWFQYNNLETAYKTVSFKYKSHFFIKSKTESPFFPLEKNPTYLSWILNRIT